MRHGLTLSLILGAPLIAGASVAQPQTEKQIAAIDLSKAFATRSPWRFVATQAPDTVDPVMSEMGKIPGAIRLCISRDQGRSCSPDLRQPLRFEPGEDSFADARYMRNARIVHPQGPAGRPLLLIGFESQMSINGDARIGLDLLAYDRARDRFSSIFSKISGRNNNQEARYVAEGPLRGAVIVAEPTGNAPFNFWITVHRLTPGFTYRQVLRYRSATHYGDGNPLAVIDSDMPNIQQRLGLWRPGKPLPLPRGCTKPRLVKMELWC
jgi:hypothetical protein